MSTRLNPHRDIEKSAGAAQSPPSARGAPHRDIENSAGAAQSPPSARGATPVRATRSWVSRAIPFVVIGLWVVGFLWVKRARSERRRMQKKALGASVVHGSHLGDPAKVAYGLHGVLEQVKRTKLGTPHLSRRPDGDMLSPRRLGDP